MPHKKADPPKPAHRGLIASLARVQRPRVFYLFSVSVGVAVYMLTQGQHNMFRVLAASDAFFTCFLVYVMGYGVRLTAEDLRRRHRGEKLGFTLMLLSAAFAVVLSLIAVFTLLNHPHSEGTLFPIFAISSVPLSWAMVQAMAAHSYTRLYYSEHRTGEPEGGLAFPGGILPGGVEFVYFAMAIGTSATVSDVSVVSRDLRIATMIHSMVSFSFNTVLIAIAVNAAMTLA
ncbi:MAG: DUF1345 domain-containing protein [Mangrovicoccus sp.]|nr:DUF1345 domain-containing protein [Mangrovicoccus sp.]